MHGQISERRELSRFAKTGLEKPIAASLQCVRFGTVPAGSGPHSNGQH
ncbi:hypothetical protein FRUB_07498 [Fimbriiglobus ruber]|uniref:Uncharacterized protein n=1 Tax=Fimbriiglobus ruber TaxID=1908690 RepID=A0A225DIH6_9BACT|nr:hypothetical protein FRUB_07498 [Fimbriiglobus ruber]